MPKSKEKCIPGNAALARPLGCPLVALDSDITLAITGVASFVASDGTVVKLVAVEWDAEAMETGTVEAG